MELETYIKAVAIKKAKDNLEENLKYVDEAMNAITPFEFLVFEWKSGYERKLSLEAGTYREVLESIKCIIETKIKELEQQFKEL